MKIISNLKHNILPISFSYGNKHHLVVSTIVYMDIPTQEILNLTKLWSETQDFLRRGQPLDEFFPKSNGEIIIYGNCHSKESVSVKEVGFKLIGEKFQLNKELIVMGDRILRKNYLGQISITRPKEFTKMKVGYENAYGGIDFSYNPMGKGFNKDFSLNSEISMHNIDIEKKLVVTHKDKNAIPRSFEPSNIGWKNRVKKLGTYDEDWKRNYWPYYAKDIDFDVFNSVSEDQRISGFFRGDESFEIYNMHPEYPLIEGKLPNKVVKTFVTKMIEGEETLIELKTFIDTVIFFPEIQRVAIVNRAMTVVNDDDFSEIETLFTVSEDRDEKEHPLSYYEELRQKKLDDPLDIKDKISNVMPQDKLVDFKDLNFLLEIELRRHLKQSPEMIPSSKSVKMFQTKYAGYIEEYLQRTDLPKSFVASLHELKKLTNHNYITDKAVKNIDDMKDHNKELIEDKIKKAQVKYPDLDIQKEFDQQVLKMKNNPQLTQLKTDGHESVLIQTWSDGARFLLADKNYILKNSTKKYEELIKFGLREATINNILYVGYNEEEELIIKDKWKDNKTDIHIDIGYILGYFEEDKVKKLVLRKNIFDKNDNYLGAENDIKIDGSSECELILKGTKNEYIIIVDEILEAYLLFQDFWQICSIVVMKSKEDFVNSKYFSNNKEHLKYIFTTKFDLELEGIQSHNLNIRKNIYEEYIVLKRDLEYEVLYELPDNKYNNIMRRELKKKKKLGLNYVGIFDIKSQENRARDYIFGNIDKSCDDEFLEHIDEKMKKDIISKVKKYKDLVVQGEFNDIKNPDDLLSYIKEALKNLYKENPSKEAKNKIKKYVSNLEDMKTLNKSYNPNPKQEVIPESMKKNFKKYFNTDLSGTILKFYSQEELSEYYNKNLSFDNAIFEIEEISNILIDGASFCYSIWNNVTFYKVIFSNCSFTNATFNNCVLVDCSFEESDMKSLSVLNMQISKSKIKNSILKELQGIGSEFESVVFDNCDISRSMYSDCKFSQCDFLATKLEDLVAINNILEESNFTQCSLEGSIYTDSIMSHCTMIESNLNKVTFIKSDITNCDLSNIEAKRLFFPSRGVNVKDVNFSKSNLDDAYFNESNFSNVDFSYVSLNRSVIQNCVIQNSNMTGIDALESSFQKTEFNNCDMQGMNLAKGSLRKTHLVESNLSNSNLYGCMIFNTKLRETLLKNCNLDKTHLKDGKERYLDEN